MEDGGRHREPPAREPEWCVLPRSRLLRRTQLTIQPAEEDAWSEASEWELRERRGREEERRAEAEEQPLFLPTPSFMAPADED